MPENDNRDKVNRVLALYTRLMNGAVINKSAEATNYGVTERSIQRDIDDVRDFLEQTESTGITNTIIYDRGLKGYRIEKIYTLKLTNPEILAICKILLDSRSLRKDEMEALLGKLIECCVPENNRKLVFDLIRNEEFHYIEPHHRQRFLDLMWDIGQAIHEHRIIEFDYQGLKSHSPKHRRVQPQAIMFSEYYFYLVAFIENIDRETAFTNPDDAFPTIYRIDRIKNCKVCEEHYHIPYKDRFEEGDFRKRIQFMFGGKLRRVKFRYTGMSIEAVIDRLPTAKVTEEKDGSYIVEAEVFGDGIDMWLRSQGDMAEVM